MSSAASSGAQAAVLATIKLAEQFELQLHPWLASKHAFTSAALCACKPSGFTRVTLA